MRVKAAVNVSPSMSARYEGFPELHQVVSTWTYPAWTLLKVGCETPLPPTRNPVPEARPVITHKPKQRLRTE